MSDYLDPNNEELLKDFFTEAEQMVEMLEANVLVLENEPGNSEAIDEIFRAAHTLKGSAATVQMSELSSFTHLIEDLLDEIRSGAVRATSEIIDALLESIDLVKAMIRSREEGKPYEGDTAAVTDRLRSFQAGSAKAVKGGRKGRRGRASGGQEEPAIPEPQGEEAAGDVEGAEAAPVASATPPVPEAEISPEEHRLTEYELLELREAAPAGSVVYRARVEFNPDNPMNSVGGIQVFAAIKKVGTVLKTVPEFERLYEDTFYSVVEYYVAGSSGAERLREAATISDVTLSAEVTEVGMPAARGPSAKEPAERQAAAPAASAPGAVGSGEAASAAPVSELASQEVAAPPSEASPPPAAAPAAASAPSPASAGAPAAPVTTGRPAGAEEGDEIEERARDSKRPTPKGSILRVDSKRIDVLLNLVSEAVINKGAFNQISIQFGELQNEVQSSGTAYRERLRELFTAVGVALEQVREGQPVREIRRDLLARFGDLAELLDPLEAKLKSSVSKFRNTAQNLGRITTELHERVLQIRMVPIAQIFTRFPRLVRDLSKSLGKQVDLIIEGEDTELDKSVIEDLLDPLIHCVRNSIDHGIESTERRVAIGKPAAGRVLLRAKNEGNLIVIEVSDDGAGIDLEAVHRRAAERGIIHPSKSLSEVEAFGLIFEPGFSTAKQVSDISGRGVGLDVVKRQIEKLNGQVTVWSERSVGTRFTIKLPLTLAIIQGLLIRVGPEIYAIPVASVVESHRIKMSQVRMLDNYEVIEVRDDVISLMRLNRIFKVPSDEQRDVAFVVIVGSSDKKIGLMVDALIGEEDVVIKPLKDRYSASPGVAGATILGDGRVALILDVGQLLELGQRRERDARRRRAAAIG